MRTEEFRRFLRCLPVPDSGSVQTSGLAGDFDRPVKAVLPAAFRRRKCRPLSLPSRESRSALKQPVRVPQENEAVLAGQFG